MDIIVVFLAGGLGVFLLMGLLVLHEKFAAILRRILPRIAEVYRKLIFHNGKIRIPVLFVMFGSVSVLLYIAGK
jgi:hypothetical protein